MEPITTNNIRILIVEDEIITGLSFQSTLEALGHEVIAIILSGEDAIQHALDHQPDLILMDIKLAGEIDGIEAVVQIQKSLDIPVIYMTGYADDAILQRAKLTEPYGYLVKPVDVSEIKRTINMALYKHGIEKQLKASEKRYRTLFESVPVGLFRSTPDGQILDANPAMVEMLGYPNLETLIASGAVASYVNPTDREIWKSKMAEHRVAENYEVQWRQYDGTVIWVRNNAQLIGNCVDAPFCYEGSVIDITAEKLAQQTLREAHDKLEQRVIARTAELTKVNTRLEAEIHERQRAEETLRRYADEQNALYTITSAAVGFLEPTALLNAALDAVLPAVNAEAGWITLPSEEPVSPHQIVTWRGVSQAFINHLNTTPIDPCIPCYNMMREHNIEHSPDLILDCPRKSDNFMIHNECEYTIGIPLRVGNQVLGVIDIVWPNKPNMVDHHQFQYFLIAIGQQIGLALHNAQLYQSAQQVDRLKTINAISTAVTSSLELDMILPKVVSLVCSALGCTEGYLFLKDEDSSTLILSQQSPTHHTNPDDQRLRTVNKIAEWVTHHQHTLMINDSLIDIYSYDTLPDLTELPNASVLCAPLAYLNKITGVLVFLTEHPMSFTNDSVSMLEAISTTCAAAITNARLHTNLKRALKEKQRTQELLIQSEKMSALGRLAASIAHEINNPLQAVLGCMMLSQEELEGAYRREKLEGHLGIAVTEVQRISEIVRRMHDFYRHAQTQHNAVRPHKILDDVLSLSNKQLQHNHISVRREYDEAVVTLHANADHLKQVFLNLILNAMDAMPEGGTLTINTQLIIKDTILQYPSEIPAVQIRFIDTGMGMSPEIQSRIFEPFFTTKQSGSGLGLVISYGIVEAHNGAISVTSEEGKGTTFIVELPVQQPKQTRADLDLSDIRFL